MEKRDEEALKTMLLDAIRHWPKGQTMNSRDLAIEVGTSYHVIREFKEVMEEIRTHNKPFKLANMPRLTEGLLRRKDDANRRKWNEMVRVLAEWQGACNWVLLKAAMKGTPEKSLPTGRKDAIWAEIEKVNAKFGFPPAPRKRKDMTDDQRERQNELRRTRPRKEMSPELREEIAIKRRAKYAEKNPPIRPEEWRMRISRALTLRAKPAVEEIERLLANWSESDGPCDRRSIACLLGRRVPVTQYKKVTDEVNRINAEFVFSGDDEPGDPTPFQLVLERVARHFDCCAPEQFVLPGYCKTDEKACADETVRLNPWSAPAFEENVADVPV